ncbi:hypothetical protein [Flammeovirga pacifica]|uniref:Uncharacterized protein n=1 Tax=Flammeovirga pacifica TaxID=915059 RepID=A0A1S1YZG6_FLAPC|nr:hypothetical protein [Flammeovirga pacifica]OHX66414.1 hypothetical protein NH26_08620 [Flammeovirga pacifica]
MDALDVSKSWLKKYRKKYQFWLQHNHPILLDTPEKLQQRLDYTQNPIKVGIVQDAKDYLYSRVFNYHGTKYNLLKSMFWNEYFRFVLSCKLKQ